jgi:hypothetical protein
MVPKNNLKIMDLQTNSAIDYRSCAFIYHEGKILILFENFSSVTIFSEWKQESVKKCLYKHSFKIKQITAPNFQTSSKLSHLFLNIIEHKDTNFIITIYVQKKKVWNGRHNSFNVILYYELFLSYNEASVANMIQRCTHCFVQLLEGDT